MPEDHDALDRIAVIDLDPLTNGGADGLHQVADALRRTLEKVGFFIVVNHGVPQDLIDRTFAEAKRFHAQPLDDKLALAMNEHNNGYLATGRRNVVTSRVTDKAAQPDANEAFFMKRERGPEDPLVREGRRFAGPNRWPDKLPGFREALLEYTAVADALGRRLLAPLAVSLDLDPDYFDAAFAESQFSFRLSHYPAVPEEADGLYGIAPHTDMNFLTLLPQSGVPGLQVLDEWARPAAGGADRWVDVPHVPGSYVVNSGDMLHRWTNGRYRSTPHRVLPPVGRDRYAIPYFFGPHLDTVIECLPSCQGPENPPQYEPITYNDYTLWWYGSNYQS